MQYLNRFLILTSLMKCLFNIQFSDVAIYFLLEQKNYKHFGGCRNSIFNTFIFAIVKKCYTNMSNKHRRSSKTWSWGWSESREHIFHCRYYLQF